MIWVILLLSAFIRLYHITTQVPFFGDQGWFYISARNMLLTHHLPLVGITSSHVWLHQGALWTYILGIIFLFTNFNTIAPVICTALIGILTTYLVYLLGVKIFTKGIALVASFIFAVSPLIIMQSRTAYHTSLIATCVLFLLWSIYKLREGNKWYFLGVFVTLALLYNLELATISIIFGTLLIVCLETRLRKNFIAAMKKPMILLSSIVGITVIMLPMLLYDVTHGFSQTVKFVGWLGYKLLTFIPHLVTLQFHPDPSLPFGSYSSIFISRLLFLPNTIVAIIIFTLINIVGIIVLIHKLKVKQFYFTEQLLFCFYFIPLLFYILQFIPSEGYTPMLFPGFVYFTGYTIMNLPAVHSRRIAILFSGLLLLINIPYMIQHAMLTTPDAYGYSLETRENLMLQAKKEITTEPVRIIYHGPLDIFESNRDNYTYLLWYRGVKIDQQQYKQTISITDTGKNLSVTVLK